jgi:ABC-type glycerol-3-phosphate transport system permease component
MTWDDVFWHLLNFALPALAISLGITAWGAFQFRRQPQIRWFWRWLINLTGGVAVLVGGLMLTDHDGKMATYGALILVCATLEWALQTRLFRRG